MKALGFFLAVLLSVVPAQAQPAAPDMRLWSEQVVSDIMAYDAGNFDSKLENNRHLFTKTGYIKYMRALNQAKIPDLIKKDGYEARVKILCGAQFLPPLAADKEGVIRVRVPIEQSYATKAQMLTRKNMVIDLVLHPDSSGDVPDRMAIDQIIAAIPKKSEPLPCANEPAPDDIAEAPTTDTPAPADNAIDVAAPEAIPPIMPDPEFNNLDARLKKLRQERDEAMARYDKEIEALLKSKTSQ